MSEEATRPPFLSRTGVTILAVVVVTAAAVAGGPRVWQWWQNRAAQSLSRSAMERLQEGDLKEAAKLAGEACRRFPGNPQAIRTLAHLLDRTSGGAERALFAWQQVCASDGVEPVDRIGLAGALLRAGRPAEAREILEKLPEQARNCRAALELEAGLLRYNGRPTDAEATLREALSLAPDDPDARLELSRLDLASPFPEVRERAAKELWTLAHTIHGGTAVKVLVLLAEKTPLDPAKASDLREQMARLEFVPDTMRYRILSGCLRADPAAREAMISAETARTGGSSPAQRMAFLQWLSSSAGPERVLAMLDGETARLSPGLCELYAADMVKAGRCQQLKDFIRKTPALPLSLVQLSLIQATCAQGLHAPAAEVRQHLLDAAHHAEAEGSQPGLTAVASTAGSLGQDDVALEALGFIAKRPQSRLAALDRMLQIYHRQRNLPAMLATIDRCLAEQPGLSPYVETACYLRLLSGTKMELMRDEAFHLGAAGEPVTPAVHLVRALAAYRFADHAAAEKEAGAIDTAQLPAGQRAVLSGILRACGRTSDAFQLAEKIPQGILLDEEAAFLHAAL